MHDQIRPDWDDAIIHMSDEEKKNLVHALNASLQRGSGAARGDSISREAKQAILDWLNEIESLPCSAEPEDGLVASIDHDKILYGRGSDRGDSSRKSRP